MSDYQDKEITCVDGNDHTFLWKAKDQAFYAEKGFTPPKRCREHAQARRAFFDSHPEKAGGKPPRRQERRDRDEFGDE